MSRQNKIRRKLAVARESSDSRIAIRAEKKRKEDEDKALRERLNAAAKEKDNAR